MKTNVQKKVILDSVGDLYADNRFLNKKLENGTMEYTNKQDYIGNKPNNYGTPEQKGRRQQRLKDK